MAAEKVMQIGVFRVTTLVTGRLRENCYLVRHEPSGEQLIIDPGSDFDTLSQAIDAGGGKLTHLLLTHGHFDHVGAVAKICQKYSLTCAVHQGDVRLLRQAPFWAIRFVRQALDQPKPFAPFDNDAVFEFAGERVKIIPTPGHTQGSVCLAIGGFVFTGDTLFYRHIGPTDYPESNPEQLPVSITDLLACLSPDTVIFPGHGRPWSIGEAASWWSEVGSEAPKYHILKDASLRPPASVKVEE